MIDCPVRRAHPMPSTIDADASTRRVPDAEHRDQRRAVRDAAPDDHRSRPERRRADRDDRGRAAVTERVVTAREQQERAVGIQTERQRRDAGREQPGPGLGRAPERDEPHHRAARSRPARPRPGSRAAPCGRAPSGSTGRTRRGRRPRRRFAISREDRGVDRLREHGVGREEERERDLIGDHAARDAVAGDERRAEQQRRARVQQHAPHREAREPRQRRVAAVPARSQREARPPAATTRMPTNASTPPVPATASSVFSATVRSKPGSGPASTRNDDEAHDDHDAAADRRGGGDREPSLRVQQAGRDRAERVEDHLRHEEPEQERREVTLLGADLRVRRAAREQPREQRREHDAEHRDRRPSRPARSRTARSRGDRPPRRRRRRRA